MDKISKALRLLSPREQALLKAILIRIKQGDLKGHDLRKLKGHDDIFRIRKGDIRIIFSKKEDKIMILAIERRSDNTYDI
jgi:mRNA-degrading endonuclease RelE of RelBE toxin-antitoxin system